MAVKIRLARRGRKKNAFYSVVIADSRAPRDGRYIKKIGVYNPNTDPATVNLDEDAAFDWIMKGAQPTDTVRTLLSYRGILMRKHLQVGVDKGAITQEVADARLVSWKENKFGIIQSKVDRLAKEQSDADASRLAAEAKKSADRAEAIRAKQAEAEGIVADAEETAEGETEAVEAEVETPAAEAPAAEEKNSEAAAE